MKTISEFWSKQKTLPGIRYAQCWEDPDVLNQALEVGPEDDVLSVGSGGDNTFSLLMQNPRSITAVDYNSAQIFLIKLKQVSIQLLEYEEFIRFLGVLPCTTRLNMYRLLRPAMDEQTRTYWDRNSQAIAGGVIHYGKFERYFSVFRKLILPMIHPYGKIDKCMGAETLSEQKIFYNQQWNTYRWRALFRIFFSKILLGNLGRDPVCFKYVDIKNIANELLQRVQHGLTEIPVKNNYFLTYMLKGSYPDLKYLPPYLQEINFRFLKSNVHRVKLIIAPVENYLQELDPGSISKFNLSDIFEYMSDDLLEKNLDLILRVGRNKARIGFWTLFVPRRIPSVFSYKLKSDTDLAQELHKCERTFFYSSFNLWYIQNV